MIRRSAATFAALVLVGCGSTGSPSATQQSNSTVAISASDTAPSTSETAAQTDMIVGPGEPWIAYQLPHGNNLEVLDIRLVRPDGTGDHPLLVDRPGNQTHPDWSPDGNRLTYTVNETQLWTADVDGTNPTKLPIECSSPCALVDNAAWSPDGRTILFSRLESSPNDVPVSQVQSIDLATGTVTTLFTTAPLQGVDYPRWSPDGKSIVFTINRFDSLEAPGPNGTAIATLDITTPSSEPVILTDWSAFGTYPDWSPDGTSIVFSTYDLERRFTIPDPSQPSDLYTMNPDGTALTEITHNPSGTALIRLNSASGPLSTQPTWSPDSKSIIFTQVDGPEWPGWTLATIGADGTNQASATESIPMTGTHPRLRPIP